MMHSTTVSLMTLSDPNVQKVAFAVFLYGFALQIFSLLPKQFQSYDL